MHLEMYQLHTIFSIVSSHTFMQIPCSISEFYTAGFFCSLFYQCSQKDISHFCLYSQRYLPREEPQLHLARYQKLFRTSTMPKAWRISLTRTAEANLHVQLLKVCKAGVWSRQGLYVELQFSLSPVCQVGETKAKCHHNSKWAETVSHLCSSLFCFSINRHKDQSCGNQTGNPEPPCRTHNFLTYWL